MAANLAAGESAAADDAPSRPIVYTGAAAPAAAAAATGPLSLWSSAFKPPPALASNMMTHGRRGRCGVTAAGLWMLWESLLTARRGGRGPCSGCRLAGERSVASSIVCFSVAADGGRREGDECV